MKTATAYPKFKITFIVTSMGMLGMYSVFAAPDMPANLPKLEIL
jgi:hypothetical protein